MGVNNLTPINGRPLLVDEVKGKPCNFEACLCGSLYSTFTASFYPYVYYNQRFSKTNSTDPRQRVPLSLLVIYSSNKGIDKRERCKTEVYDK